MSKRIVEAAPRAFLFRWTLATAPNVVIERPAEDEDASQLFADETGAGAGDDADAAAVAEANEKAQATVREAREAIETDDPE